MQNHHFKVLLLLARPAAGKSEIIDYLKNTEMNARLNRFHITDFEEIDDFPMLWTWFEEDAILEKMGEARLHTDSDGYFKGEYLWHLLIERITLEYQKRLRDEDYHKKHTTVIEFSRGSEHGGYRAAFEHLSDELLSNAAILYVDVSFEESLRKNRKRFNPDKPDSILEHGLPDEKLTRLYQHIDWDEFSAGDAEFIHIRGQKVPYVVFDNADDVTTQRGDALGARLEERLQKLWSLYKK